MTIGAFLVARLSSTRLPAKNIMKIIDRPMIDLMVERVQQTQLVDKVVITTSTDPSDDAMEELASKIGIGCYRGPLDNIMERIAGAAEAFDCDTIVELLGDNPLVHSDLINDVVELYLNGGYDYAASVTREYPIAPEIQEFALGIRVQAYSKRVAEQWVNYSKEYWGDESKGSTAYIFEHPETFRIGYLEAIHKWTFLNRPTLNFAVNYRKNFDFVRMVFERNYPQNPNFSLKQVCEQLDEDRYLYLLMGSE